jgi:hypothetical protein
MAYTPPMSFTSPDVYTPVYGNSAKVASMPSGDNRAAYEKAMSDTYANTLVSPGIFGTPIGEQRGYTGQGVTSRAGINAQPTPGGGGSMSISLGGGNRGSSTPAGPNVSLTPQTFAPYESTYTPPTPATPVPYDYATAGPYVYGQGLSNAGAAYDIWGSKPGTNPYLLSTPADYTPGLIGLDPVTLPNNMPNRGADISAFTPATTTPPRINLGYNDRKDYVAPGDTYKGANHGARKPGGGNPNPNAPAQVTLAKDSTNPAVKAKLAAYRASDTKQTGAAKAITSYTNKKSAPVSRPVAPAGGYSTKDYNTNFKTRRDVRNLFA